MNGVDIVKAEALFILEMRNLENEYTVNVEFCEGLRSIKAKVRRSVILVKTLCTITGGNFTIGVPCPVTRKQKNQFFNTFSAEIKALEHKRFLGVTEAVETVQRAQDFCKEMHITNVRQLQWLSHLEKLSDEELQERLNDPKYLD